MQLDNTKNLLSLFETSRADRTAKVNDVLEMVLDGTLDPIQVHLQLKCMEDMITMLTSSDPKKNKNPDAAKKFKEVLLEAAKRHGKSFEMYNAKFGISEMGTKYDYTVCEDFVWNDLQIELANLKERISTREKFLQNIPAEGTASPEYGTMIFRANKSSTTSITVSLK